MRLLIREWVSKDNSDWSHTTVLIVRKMKFTYLCTDQYNPNVQRKSVLLPLRCPGTALKGSVGVPLKLHQPLIIRFGIVVVEVQIKGFCHLKNGVYLTGPEPLPPLGELSRGIFRRNVRAGRSGRPPQLRNGPIGHGRSEPVKESAQFLNAAPTGPLSNELWTDLVRPYLTLEIGPTEDGPPQKIV